MSGKPKLGKAAADTLWLNCAKFLLRRAATPPPTPVDWTQPLTGEQRTKLRADLKKFALDPEHKVLRLSIRKELRQEVHRMIDKLGLDMTSETERRGSPYTLVLTKTLGYYDRACRQYEKDYAGMRRLADLPGARAKSNFKEAKRLMEAVEAGADWKQISANKLDLPA